MQLIRRFTKLLDDPYGFVTHCSNWPDAFIEECLSLGLLSRADDAHHIECPFCHGCHTLAVNAVWQKTKLTLIGTCPESGIRCVPERLVRRYRPQWAGIRTLLSVSLGRRELQPDSLPESCLGHFYRDGHDYAVFLLQDTPDWKSITRSNPRCIALCSDPARLQDAPASVIVVELEQVLRWSAANGIQCTFTGLNDTAIPGGPHVESSSRDGFVEPNTLIFRGSRYDLQRPSAQTKRLLTTLVPTDRTKITRLVGKKKIWAGLWPRDRTALGGRIRAAITKLNQCLMTAKPPAPCRFEVDLRNDEIRRVIRKHF